MVTRQEADYLVVAAPFVDAFVDRLFATEAEYAVDFSVGKGHGAQFVEYQHRVGEGVQYGLYARLLVGNDLGGGQCLGLFVFELDDALLGFAYELVEAGHEVAQFRGGREGNIAYRIVRHHLVDAFLDLREGSHFALDEEVEERRQRENDESQYRVERDFIGAQGITGYAVADADIGLDLVVGFDRLEELQVGLLRIFHATFTAPAQVGGQLRVRDACPRCGGSG